MSSKTDVADKIAKAYIVLGLGDTMAMVHARRVELARDINTAIRHAVAADRRKRGKKTKGSKR
jgi:hypothetical protein